MSDLDHLESQTDDFLKEFEWNFNIRYSNYYARRLTLWLWNYKNHIYAAYGSIFPSSLSAIAVYFPYMLQGLVQGKIDFPILDNVFLAISGLTDTFSKNASAVDYLLRSTLITEGTQQRKR